MALLLGYNQVFFHQEVLDFLPIYFPHILSISGKLHLFSWERLDSSIFVCMRGVQEIRGQMLPCLHWLSNRAGITARNTATYMQLIGYNMLGVSCLRALQLSSRQRYIA